MAHKRSHKKRGPKANRLVIGDNWKKTVGKALKKQPPPGGWPKR